MRVNFKIAETKTAAYFFPMQRLIFIVQKNVRKDFFVFFFFFFVEKRQECRVQKLSTTEPRQESCFTDLKKMHPLLCNFFI